MRRLAVLLVALAVLEGTAALALFLLGAAAGIHYRTMPSLLGPEQRAMIEAMIEESDVWYQQPDPELGWINGAGIRFGGAAQNSQRVRSRREYAPLPPPGVMRVAAFGDSFVHGDEVADRDVWSGRIERECGSVEVLNFGVSGYGVDQSYLRYLRDGRRFRADLVLIGFLPDQLARNVNVFRPFLAPETGHQMTKPRFVLEDGALRLRPNPLRDGAAYRRLLDDPETALGDDVADDWYFPGAYRSGRFDLLATVRLGKIAWGLLRTPQRPPLLLDGQFNRASEAYSITLALLETFAEVVRRDGAKPLVVLFPDADDLRRSRSGEPASYAPLVEDLRARDVPLLDLTSAFAAQASDGPVKGLFAHLHYSPLGNAMVARALEAEIDSGAGASPTPAPRCRG